MTSISVIIPCYNCERTLEQAIASVFEQNSPIPFDVTMVDDGSTDGTYRLMQRLAARYPRVKIVQHDLNRGGGAARNTAVSHSTGEVIFCLDSDDMMGRDFLRNLVTFWMEKQCDGVGIGTSIKFKKDNLKDVAYVTNFSRPGERVPFESLLDGSECSLMSTFLITRQAFEHIGGYPTEHGFDTQGMAWRFLGNGLNAYTCPDALYHHRVEFHQSYYLREDRARRYNWNWLLILSEFLYLFTDDAKELILGRELLPSGAAPTLQNALQDAAKQAPIFVDNYRDLVRKGRHQVAVEVRDSPDKYDQFWMGEYLLSSGQAALAMRHYQRALSQGLAHWILACRITQASLSETLAAPAVDFAFDRMRLHVTASGITFHAIVPPLSAYQRFENWLLRKPLWNRIGVLLKHVRLLLKKAREAD